MARSAKKWLAIDFHTLKATQQVLLTPDGIKKMKPIEVKRSDVIIPSYVGMRFRVHNGKDKVIVLVSEDMIAHKFGEFVPTRKIPNHPSTKIAKRNNK